MVSRQRKWQIRMREQGRCTFCGQPAGKYVGFCDRHAVENQLRYWRREGKKPPRKTIERLIALGLEDWHSLALGELAKEIERWGKGKS